MNPWIIIGNVVFSLFLVLAFFVCLIAAIVGTASASTVGFLIGCCVGSVIVGWFVLSEVLR